MKAAVLREINKPLEIEDIQHGDPGPREVLIRTVAAGSATPTCISRTAPIPIRCQPCSVTNPPASSRP
jgi:Zn-dependent alcohol dehydrogenase